VFGTLLPSFSPNVTALQNSFEQDIRIYGAATRPQAQGASIINGHIANLHCKDTWTVAQCTDGLSQFREVIQYVQLKSEQDFRSLQSTLSTPVLDPSTGALHQEALRVFYLSVSPSLYDGLAASIHSLARPRAAGAEMRVVFEKPFGRDLASAQRLSEQLAAHLLEQEIFRVSEGGRELGREGGREGREGGSG
jgi:hexose-6-phosphate dehydrogenase